MKGSNSREKSARVLKKGEGGSRGMTIVSDIDFRLGKASKKKTLNL